MPDQPTTPSARVLTRREVLGLLGAGGVAVVAGCGGGSSDTAGGAPTTSPSTTSAASSPASSAAPTVGGDGAPAACVLTPEMTEGPYFIDGEAVRRDITEGSPGAPLRLDLTVVDAAGCRPVPGAAVDVWHANAAGDYSGFGSATSNRTFLRGIQNADADGKVSFRTIYPGWYQGRAVHIHVKVHAGGAEVHTGQLFFDEAVSDAVYRLPAYSGRSGRRTTNAQDSIYRSGGAQSLLALTREGEGYVGMITLAVRGSSAASGA